MKPTTHASSLPRTGPGSSYAHPVHRCSLPMAMQIAQRRGGPIMAQIITARGITVVGKMHPGGTWEVSP